MNKIKILVLVIITILQVSCITDNNDDVVDEITVAQANEIIKKYNIIEGSLKLGDSAFIKNEENTMPVSIEVFEKFISDIADKQNSTEGKKAYALKFLLDNKSTMSEDEIEDYLIKYDETYGEKLSKKSREKMTGKGFIKTRTKGGDYITRIIDNKTAIFTNK